jgi:hypothetical protein
MEELMGGVKTWFNGLLSAVQKKKREKFLE